LWSLLHSPFSSLLGPNIRLRILFSNIRASYTIIKYNGHTRRPISCIMSNIVARVQHLIQSIDIEPFKSLLIKWGIGYGTCQRILTHELGMHHVAAKFVPRILSVDHKQQHLAVCLKVCQPLSDDLMTRDISGDENWIYGYDPETILPVEDPKLTKTKKVKGKVKSILLVFFDAKGLCTRICPTKPLMFYCNIFQRLHESAKTMA
jgi:hypothetical protein